MSDFQRFVDRLRGTEKLSLVSIPNGVRATMEYLHQGNVERVHIDVTGEDEVFGMQELLNALRHKQLAKNREEIANT